MEVSRRRFTKRLASFALISFGGSQLAGCLGGDSGSDSAPPSSGSTSQAPAQSEVAAAPAAATAAVPAQPAQTQTAQNAGPVWQPAPSVEFVEGVPAVVSVRQFVRDPDNDPLIIALKSGQLLPGITFNPNNATLAYDGRPLGAKPNAPVMVTGITFSADDQKP